MKAETANTINIVVALAGILAGLLLIGAMVAPVAAGKAPDGGPDDQKLDVGIYDGINSEGNPIEGDPKDQTVFTFTVVWTVVRITDAGTVISAVTVPVGEYISRQDEAGAFPYLYGKPYTLRYCSGLEIGPLCIGTMITEEGYYHIGHTAIPDGYCPQFPDGQDRKKSGTTTENQKFFRGDACGQLYPGWDGRFGYCTKDYRRCYILIR